jgi:hypothetical protein
LDGKNSVFLAVFRPRITHPVETTVFASEQQTRKIAPEILPFLLHSHKSVVMWGVWRSRACSLKLRGGGRGDTGDGKSRTLFASSRLCAFLSAIAFGGGGCVETFAPWRSQTVIRTQKNPSLAAIQPGTIAVGTSEYKSVQVNTTKGKSFSFVLFCAPLRKQRFGRFPLPASQALDLIGFNWT